MAGEKRHSAASPVDIARFFGSCGLAVVFLVGYVYSVEYFRGFGISLMHADISSVQAIVTGALLVLGLGGKELLGIMFVVMALSALAIWWSGRLFGDSGFYGCIIVLFILICYGASYYATLQGRYHSWAVAHGEAGYPTYCQLKKSASISDEFRRGFEKLTKAGKMRKVFETGTGMYLSVERESEVEESLFINKSDIAHCRVFTR